MSKSGSLEPNHIEVTMDGFLQPADFFILALCLSNLGYIVDLLLDLLCVSSSIPFLHTGMLYNNNTLLSKW